jgi:hypothetical protein
VRAADRDPARSYERLDESDLARLGRAPQKLNSARSSHATHTLIAGRTGCASSPWRKAVPSITCAAAAVYGTSTSSSASPKTRASRASSAAQSSPGTGVLPNSGAARTTRRNTSAVLLMSSSGLSPTGRTQSPGYENGWGSVQRKRYLVRPRLDLGMIGFFAEGQRGLA